MRVLTWNLNHRSVDSPQWDYFRQVDPDVALLQEANKVPKDLLTAYDTTFENAITDKGLPVSFMRTGVAVKGKIIEPIDLLPNFGWAQAYRAIFDGSVLARKVELNNGTKLNVVSVHSPAWALNIKDLKPTDIDSVRLDKSKKIWIADLLTYSLKFVDIVNENWIIAGDFNLCELLDKRPPGPNIEYLERMADYGWQECLRTTNGKLTPTFNGKASYLNRFQLDYLFVNSKLAGTLKSCVAGAIDEIFGDKLSDHLPVMAEFANAQN